MFRFSTNLAKGPPTKKTIDVLNQLGGRLGYSYIRNRFLNSRLTNLPHPLNNAA